MENEVQKHRDLIIAWANGATIQYRTDNIWYDVQDNHPSWSNHTEYRIKPQFANIKAVPETYGCDGCVSSNQTRCHDLIKGLVTLGLPKCAEGYIYVKV
jgi:hypothetical protein